MVSDFFIICIKSGKLQQPYVLCKQRDDPAFPKVHLSIQDFVVVSKYLSFIFEYYLSNTV